MAADHITVARLNDIAEAKWAEHERLRKQYAAAHPTLIRPTSETTSSTESVIDEQFLFLVHHHAECRRGDECWNCCRYERLKAVLLAPFYGKTHRQGDFNWWPKEHNGG